MKNRNGKFSWFDLVGWISIGTLIYALLMHALFPGVAGEDVPFGMKIFAYLTTLFLTCGITMWVSNWLHRIGRACDKIERILEKIEGEQSANQSEQNDQSKH